MWIYVYAWLTDRNIHNSPLSQYNLARARACTYSKRVAEFVRPKCSFFSPVYTPFLALVTTFLPLLLPYLIVFLKSTPLMALNVAATTTLLYF